VDAPVPLAATAPPVAPPENLGLGPDASFTPLLISVGAGGAAGGASGGSLRESSRRDVFSSTVTETQSDVVEAPSLSTATACSEYVPDGTGRHLNV